MDILLTSTVDPMRSAYGRLHEFCRHLSHKHSLSVLSVRDSWKGGQKASESYSREASRYLSRVKIHYLSKKDSRLSTQELTSRRTLKGIIDQDIGESHDLILDYNTLLIGQNLGRLLPSVPRIYDLADDIPDMVRISPQVSPWIAPVAAAFSERKLRRSVRFAAGVTATTQMLIDMYAHSAKVTSIVPNGVSSSFFQELPASQIIDVRENSNEFVICYVGVLREWVDFTSVFEAVSHLERVMPIRIVIVGDEGNRRKIEEIANRFGVSDSICMIDTIPHDRIRSYISSSDCCVIPFTKSRTTDMAFPLKLLEYLACGVPVISTRLESVERLFPNEVVFYSNAKEFASGIKKIQDRPDLAKEKAICGKKRVQSDFTWEKSLDRLDALIDKVVKRNFTGNRALK